MTAPQLNPLSIFLLLFACSNNENYIVKGSDECEAGVWYVDADGDGFGGDEAVADCDQPEGHVENSEDCDDANSARYPNAPETCNQIDDDCDLAIDEDAIDPQSFHLDNDGDGYGDPNATTTACEIGDNMVSDNTDCNDADPAISPSGIEVCNSVDDNCDGQIDNNAVDTQDWHLDADNDGYGNPDTIVNACTPPNGYVGNSDDCDDTEAGLNVSCENTPATATTCSGQVWTASGSNTSEPELHILSAYEPLGSSNIHVHVDRLAQMTLLLSSYEPVTWHVTVASGTQIDQILLNGYHAQQVNAPNQIPTLTRSYDQNTNNFGYWCGYEYPYVSNGGCDTDALISGVEAFSGIGLTSFTGCYSASEFVLQ